MSFLSRLFGRSRPKKPDAKPAPPTQPAPPPRAPRPDPAVVTRAEEASVAQAITEGDAAALARWVLEGSTTRVRQLAAGAITAPEQLAALIPAVRGKDKNVYRILSARRDEQLAARRASDRRQVEIAEAATAITRHLDRPCDVSYAATLARLEARWNAVATDAAPERQDEVRARIAQAHAKVEAYHREAEAAAELERAAAAAIAQANAEARARQEEAARAAADASVAQSQVAAAELEAQRAQRAQELARERELTSLLRQAAAALEHGGTARATRLLEALRARLPEAPPPPPWFERKLQEVEARLAELRDWKTFTVVPKRAELVARMEALVGADMSPEELARNVRRLREEWRSLHRGVAEETAAPEREQFEQAAERAFAPAREHFAHEAERRRQNEAAREDLITQLQALASRLGEEEPVEARMLEHVLGDARRAWREHAPVDQAVVKPLQERFHAVLEELRSRLEAVYARNEQDRRGLISRAAALASAEDVRQAIEDVRGLQAEWRSAGPVSRRRDEELWREFRGHCDAVYARSSEQRERQGAELAAGEAQAIAWCEEAEQLATLDGSGGVATAARLGELREAFDALALPRHAARDLRRRFAHALERAEESLRRRRRDQAREASHGLLRAAARIRAFGCATARADESAAAIREAAATELAALDGAPREARALLERQFERAAVATGADFGENAARLREICVRAELVTGLESPPDDRELRRALQMRRLLSSMGQGAGPSTGELDALTLEWLAVGPVEPGVEESLQARFERARDID